MGSFVAALLALASGGLSGCAHAQDNSPVGVTLLFHNKGPYSLGVSRFDPDGQRGPVPGALGVGGMAQMAFMAGDSNLGIPKFVEVEWSLETPAIKQLRTKRDEQFTDYSKPWMEETKRINALHPRLIRRLDLTPILTDELIAQVRANRGDLPPSAIPVIRKSGGSRLIDLCVG